MIIVHVMFGQNGSLFKADETQSSTKTYQCRSGLQIFHTITYQRLLRLLGVLSVEFLGVFLTNTRSNLFRKQLYHDPEKRHMDFKTIQQRDPMFVRY